MYHQIPYLLPQGSLVYAVDALRLLPWDGRQTPVGIFHFQLQIDVFLSTKFQVAR